MIVADTSGEPVILDARASVTDVLAWAARNRPDIIAQEKAAQYEDVPEDFVVRDCPACRGSGVV